MSDITIRELRDRLISLHDELGVYGHIMSPRLARQYQEAVAHCIAAVQASAEHPIPPPDSNVVEFRPTG